MSKEVKFTFYEMEIELYKNIFDFEVKDFLSKPLDIKSFLFEIGGYKGFLKKWDDNIYIFQKFKKDFLPKIGDENGNERKIELKENEYVLEENVVFFDFNNNILIFHKNNAGFSISQLQEYLTKLLHEKAKKVILKPKLVKDTFEKLNKYNFVKTLNFRLGKINIQTLKEVGIIDPEEIRKLIDISSSASIEVTIKAKRNHSIAEIEEIKKLLQKFNFFDKLKVKASSSYEGSGEDIDLLDNILTINKKIKENKKRLDTQDLIFKIREVYEEYEPQLRKIN